MRAGQATVAVVGRQNVGKSTLANRLAGRRQAIAHESPGVTRDRVEMAAQWNGKRFLIVDTGGLTTRPHGVEASVGRQARTAAGSADLILFVVDAQAGITAEDETFAEELRKASRPVVVVANKVDGVTGDPLVAEFYRFGLGEPLGVSALHGRGSGELLDRVVELLPEAAQDQAPVESEVRFALIGRPNVGKSSLFNRLVKDERAVVHQEPGTTRDAVDSIVMVAGRPVRFIDTAGLRRPVKTQGVEYYSLVRSLRAIDSAHVALLVVDAGEGVTGEDKRAAARVVEAGRGLVAVLNKWDLVPGEERDGRFAALRRELEIFPGTPVLRASALTGSGVGRVLPALLGVHAAWAKRVPTAEVNRTLESALAAYPPPRGVGRIRYGTQVSAGPPTFVFFGGHVPPPAYRRYLEGAVRRAFGFDGVPVRLSFRARERGATTSRKRAGG